MVERGNSKVGDDIDFYCKRCRLNLYGNIASMEHGSPKTITCRTCRSTVVFAREKTEEEMRAKKLKELARIRDKNRPQFVGNVANRMDAASGTEVTKKWREATAEVDARYANRYDKQRVYEKDDLLIHREHGLGVVTEIIHENAFVALFRKVEVALEMAAETEEEE